MKCLMLPSLAEHKSKLLCMTLMAPDHQLWSLSKHHSWQQWTMCSLWGTLNSHSLWTQWRKCLQKGCFVAVQVLYSHHHYWNLQIEVLSDGDQRMSVIWICKTTPNHNPYARASGSVQYLVYLDMNTFEISGFLAYLKSPPTWVNRRKYWVLDWLH